MPVQFDPKSPSFLDAAKTPTSWRPPSTSDGKTTLHSAKDAPESSLFTQAWGYLKAAFETIYQWGTWLIQVCSCQLDASRVEIVEEAIEDPEAAGEQFAKDPEDSIVRFMLAALEDPKEFTILRNNHLKELIECITSFKKHTKTDPLSCTNALLPALAKILNPCEQIGNNGLYDALGVFIQNHPTAFKEVIKGFCQRISSSIKLSSTELATSLQTVCNAFAKILDQLSDESIIAFAVALASSTNPDHIHNAILGVIPDDMKDKQAFKTALDRCFKDDALVFAQLQDKDLIEFIGLASPVDLKQAFISSFLTRTTQEQFEQLGKVFESHCPLAAKLAKQLSSVANDTERMNNIADNLPSALILLEQLHKDFNP